MIHGRIDSGTFCGTMEMATNRGPNVWRWTGLCLAAAVILPGCDMSTAQSSRAPRHAAAVQNKASARTPASAVPTAPPESGGSLIGLAEDQLIQKLGRPAAERDDQPPAKTWRYVNKNCTVDFTLYPDVQTRIYRALAYEVINNDNSAAAKRLCLAELESRPHER